MGALSMVITSDVYRSCFVMSFPFSLKSVYSITGFEECMDNVGVLQIMLPRRFDGCHTIRFLTVRCVYLSSMNCISG